MREEYEQLELDTRRQLDKAIAQLTEDTVKTAGEMITACGEAPTAVRNRHEAFGIAAERLAKIKKAVKAIDGDTSILLGTLPDANYPAIEAVSSICNIRSSTTTTKTATARSNTSIAAPAPPAIGGCARSMRAPRRTSAMWTRTGTRTTATPTFRLASRRALRPPNPKI